LNQAVASKKKEVRIMYRRLGLWVAVLGLIAMAIVVPRVDTPNHPLEETTITTSLKSPLPFGSAIRSADAILVGTVVGLGASVAGVPAPTDPESTVVWVPVSFRVANCVKGTYAAEQVLTFAQLGGTIGRTSVVYADEEQFVVGEELLLCLYKPTGLYRYWTGGNLYADEGKYVVCTDGMARNALRGEEFPLTDLLARIAAALK
jgi:hypothetical protein